MSFTSVLKKIGSVVSTVATDASLVFPFLSPLVSLLPAKDSTTISSVESVVIDKLQGVVNLVQSIEASTAVITAAGTAVPGSVKAAAIAPQISAIFQSIELLGGKTVAQVIKDPAKFNAAMATIAGGVADALNACGD